MSISGSAATVAARIDTKGATLRQHAARGTFINAAFLVALTSLGLIKGYVVAVFLSRADFGVWGILIVGLGTLTWLKGAGVSDRYIQQSEENQEMAFQKAFTLELMLTGALILVMLAIVPVLAVAYGHDAIVLPALAIVLLYMPTIALQAPRWVFYRRMDFMRQRKLDAVEPVVGVLVTIGLAVAGAGYWSLVAGSIAGGWIGAAATMRAVPYRLALRYDHGTMREYVRFSWPLAIAGLSGLVIAQGSLLAGNWFVGLAAVGSISLASSISLYSQQVDSIVTATIYPAICAVRDRADQLQESFVKSNRVALMWGMPFGIGVALFAPDLVHHILGDRWRPAIELIRVFGVLAAFDQIGFNWDAFYRANGNTRPVAVTNLISALLFVAAVIPMTAAWGLRGFEAAMVLMAFGKLLMRGFYVVRLFPGFNVARHLVRAVLPTGPALLSVVALRAVQSPSGGPANAVLDLAVYLFVTVAASLLFERQLLRELRGYLLPSSARPGVAA